MERYRLRDEFFQRYFAAANRSLRFLLDGCRLGLIARDGRTLSRDSVGQAGLDAGRGSCGAHLKGVYITGTTLAEFCAGWALPEKPLRHACDPTRAERGLLTRIITLPATANFTVTYDNSLDQPPYAPGSGLALAQAVVDYCEYDLVRLSILFGNVLPAGPFLPFTVHLVPGVGGASWQNQPVVVTCNISVNSSPKTLPALVVAELAEVFMASQANGWVANWSNGEGLSRALATVLYPNLCTNFQTGQWWLNGDPTSPHPARSDWVDNVWKGDPSLAPNPAAKGDGDSVANGCGELFLNYLAYQRSQHWPDIIAAGAPNTNTLAETATSLGVANAFQDFNNLLSANFPPNVQFSYNNYPSAWLRGDELFPLGAVEPSPALYMRHNLADDGTSHTGSLSTSPDIIVRNNPVADPQATFSTPASIGNDMESDANVLAGRPNYVYLRVWNRGADAANVFAAVYWSPPATLVTPNMWTLIGSSYYSDVPAGSVVQVSNPGILWPNDQIPAPGHYCFVSIVGDIDAAMVANQYPPPAPPAFASFNDFVNYIYANNNITWRNFNVVPNLPHMMKRPFGEFVPLPFLITGAWDRAHAFELEVIAELPQDSRVALQVPHWLGRALKAADADAEEHEDVDTDPKEPRRLRLRVRARGSHVLGAIELPTGTAAASHLLVDIPADQRHRPYEIAIRQLYKKREVGRITWRLVPAG